MSPRTSKTISIAFIGAGALVWAFAAKPLATDSAVNVELNPFGINRSPYGEVFAMAMQGRVDTYWHQGYEAKYVSASLRAKQRKNWVLAPKSAGGHPTDPGGVGSTPATADQRPLKIRFTSMLESLDRASVERTNSGPVSEAYDSHVRQQIENKLRFAYYLDPSNYTNYNAYHFFFTELRIGTRSDLPPDALRLADETIAYCLKQPRDPRPALTASGAACNIIHLMFADRHKQNKSFNVADMRKYLTVLDQCIARFYELSGKWEASGEKNLLSPQRISEIEDRISFVCKIRDAAEGAIIRFESAQPPPAHVSN